MRCFSAVACVLLLVLNLLTEISGFINPQKAPLKTQQRRSIAGARRGKTDKNDDDDDPMRYMPLGSGMQGRDVRQMKGKEKRDAEWFIRQAERERNGELNVFEDPAFYIGLFAFTPALLGIYGILSCAIPIYCTADGLDFGF